MRSNVGGSVKTWEKREPGEGKEGRWNGTGKRKNGRKKRNGGKESGMEKDIFVLLYQLDLTRTVHSSSPAVWEGGRGSIG
jgi:hypothetical protein